jgi:hypothetical protein
MSMDYSQAANAQLQPPHSPELGRSDNYRNDLDSLFTALDRLEGAVVALDRIG